jgi:hypothetical protein
LRGKTFGQQLEDALRPGEVLQSMLAQVKDVRTGQQAIAHQPEGDFREQSLAPVSGREDTDHAVKRLAKVVPTLRFYRARVQGHSNAECGMRTAEYGRPIFGQESALACERGIQGLWSSGEGGAKGITYRLEDVAAVCLNSMVQDIIMAREGTLHRLGI